MVTSAQGFRGFYAMPRLAGQQPQYIENQLRAFVERRRLNLVMANVAHGITPDAFPALAARMSALNLPPVGGAPTGDVALGKEIFTYGLPDQNVPACSACHGPDAKGQREIPRLAGQLYWYMVSTLSLWSSERGQGGRQDISWIMRPTVANSDSADRCRRSPNMSARSGRNHGVLLRQPAEFATQETLSMKHPRTKMAVVAISLATAGPLLADDLPVRNCTWCHGASAQGVSMAPRLAGQRADYLANELEAFATHQRDEFLFDKIHVVRDRASRSIDRT